MRPQRSHGPRYCPSHWPAASQQQRRGVERNKRGVCAADGCNVRVDRRGRVREVSGANVDDVLRAHHEVSQWREKRRQGPWLSGSFYLAALVVVMAASIGASRVVPPWTVPLVVVVSLLGVGAVGALQLRHDDRLGECGFIELMKITFLRLPAVLRQSPPPNSPPNNQNETGAGAPPV